MTALHSLSSAGPLEWVFIGQVVDLCTCLLAPAVWNKYYSSFTLVIHQWRTNLSKRNGPMRRTNLAVSRTVLAVREIAAGQFEIPAAVCAGSCLNRGRDTSVW